MDFSLWIFISHNNHHHENSFLIMKKNPEWNWYYYYRYHHHYNLECFHLVRVRERYYLIITLSNIFIMIVTLSLYLNSIGNQRESNNVRCCYLFHLILVNFSQLLCKWFKCPINFWKWWWWLFYCFFSGFVWNNFHVKFKKSKHFPKIFYRFWYYISVIFFYSDIYLLFGL